MPTDDCTPEVPLRRCTKCGQEFPATNEWFSKNGNYLRSQCKDCEREYRAANAAHIAEYGREYRTANAEHIAIYRAANVEWRREYNATNAERIAKRMREWYAANAEHVAEQHHKYHVAHPERNRIQAHKRRSLKANLPFDFTPEDWQRCLGYWEHSCCICGRKPGLWHTLAQEHWIPLTDPRPDNPGTVSTNILPMCHATKGSMGQGGCNNFKSAKDPEQWLVERYGAQKAKQILKRINAYFEWVKAKHDTD